MRFASIAPIIAAASCFCPRPSKRGENTMAPIMWRTAPRSEQDQNVAERLPRVWTPNEPAPVSLRLIHAEMPTLADFHPM